MIRMKKFAAGLLAFAMLLSSLPVPAMATETETCEHQYEAMVVAPTCTQEGYTSYKCILCEDTYTADPTDPTGICNLTEVAQTPATCVQTGMAAHYVCADCGKKYADAAGTIAVEDAALVLPLAACVLQPVAEVPATCTQTGIAAHFRCTVCSALYKDEAGLEPVTAPEELTLEMLAHEFGEWEVVEYPGPEMEGLEVRSCLHCDAQESQVIPGLTCDLAMPVLTVKLDAATCKPALSWKAVAGAEYYLVYRLREDSEEVELLAALEELSVIDTLAEPGVPYLYTVMAMSSSSYSQISDPVSGTAKCLQPQVTVITDAASGKPVLSWEAVEGAVQYEVYRSTSSTKNFKLVATTAELSALIDSSAACTRYYYKVKAICANTAANSAYSAVVSHLCVCAQPAVTASSGATGGIKVTWEKVAGAKKYQIFRASEEDGTYTQIGTTSYLTYTDTKAPANQVSYYKVRAYGSSTATLGEYSAVVSLMNHTFDAWVTIVPSMPESEGWRERTCTVCGHVEGEVTPVLIRSMQTPSLTLTTNSASGKPTLSWSKSKGATKYYVYQVDAATGERTFLTEVVGRTYTVEDAVVGNTYTYQVVAVSATRCSNYSTAKSVVCKCPRPVVTFTSEPVSGKPIAQWEAVEGAVNYEVYRSTSSSKNFRLVAETADLSVIVETSNPGVTYYYRVRAIGMTEDTAGAYSTTVKHMCDCAQPVVTLSGGATSGIKVTWEKVAGAKKYQIFRASEEDGTYTHIGTTSSLSYTDTKAPANQVSYYKVRAYGADTSSLSEYSVVTSLMNHTFDAWATIVPSMPESEGWRERTCTVCGHVEGEVTPVLIRSMQTPSLTLKTDTATGKPSLSWSKSKGATKYYIYQVDAATGERTFLTEVIGRTYTIEDAVVGNTYTYQVVAVSATRCSNYSTAKSVVCKCPRPVVTFTSEPVTGKPIAQWEAVEGAVKYEVYRSTSSSKNFKLVAETADLSVMIEGSNPGGSYYYRVKAIGPVEGSDSANSAVVNHVCDCAQPVITASSGATSGIKVSWEKVAGAKKYQIFRASEEDGTYTHIGTTSSLSYTDTKAPANQVSYYKVRAYGSSTASLSEYSAVVSLMNHTFDAWVTIVPSMPESEGWRERTCTVCGHVEGEVTPVLIRSMQTPSLTLKTNTTTGKPTLSWSKSKGATKYYIYQVDAATGERTFLTEVVGRTYTIEDAVVGNTYTYQVVAVSATRCSNYSTAKSVVCRCPMPVVTVESDIATGNPVLSWAAVDGAVSYEIYRSTSSSKNFKLVTETSDLTAIVSGGNVGTTYYYRVKAIGPVEGSESANSAVVNHVCDCAQPVITLSSGANGGITISWEKVTGAKKYQIYRASTPDGTYSLVTTTSSLSYTDTKALKNQVSYYKVRAYGSSTASMGAYSEVAFMLNHTFGAWEVLTPSTPEADGLKQRVCTYCGETERQNIPQLVLCLETPALSITAETESGKPTLSWNAASKATGYLVYQVDPATQAYVLLASTEQLTYTYEEAVPGNQYVFSVVAVNSTQCSDYSAKQMVLCKCAVPQIQLEQDAETGALTLSWNASECAVGYDIYWSTTRNSGYELYTSTQDLLVIVTDNIPGVPLYFKIQAIHELDPGADSVLSAVVSLDGTSTELYVHAGWATDTCNKIVWGKVKDAATYEVYRSAEADGVYQKLVTVKGSEHVDLDVSRDNIWYYQVKAYDQKGNWLTTSQPEAADKACVVPLKIYISPSCQIRNLYSYGNTTEAVECRKIATILVASLERCGFTAMTNVTDEMHTRMPESNAWGANLHVPLHSNAYNNSAMGTQVYHDGVSGSNSQKAAKAIYSELAPLTPGTSAERMRKQPGWYEFNHSNNPTAYIEIAFHDTKTEAKWIIENRELIAEAICKGICKVYGVTYVAP